jgi:hypothetical protein
MSELTSIPAYTLQHLIDRLQTQRTELAAARVAAGFDGFVDTLLRIIKTKENSDEAVYFREVKEFGTYITEREGRSFSLETEEIIAKLGGNMPIMANALARLGTRVDCIGALGFPAIHPAFAGIHPDCRLHSFTNPGITSALEFADGKILLGEMSALHQAGWKQITDTIGLDKIIDIYQHSDLISLVNWSEIDSSSDIWRGLLRDVLPQLPAALSSRTAFFDLSDCSKRSDESIREALNLIEQFRPKYRVVLSLNTNEAYMIHRILTGQSFPDDLPHVGQEIMRKLYVDTLLIHNSRNTYAWEGDQAYERATFFVENPKISTGAGDNFNAGFCAGQLLQLDVDLSIILANAVSGFYVQSAKSPDTDEITGYLREKLYG